MKSIRFLLVHEDRRAEEKLAPARVVAFVILVAMLSAIPVVAQQSTDDNSVDAPRSDAISGRVVNVNGQPIANATVSVRAFDTQGPASVTTTDSEGSFRVSGLDPRAYIVSAVVPAYTPTPRDPASTQPNYYRVGDSVRIELMKGGVVTGTVTTSAGEPVVGIQVHAYMLRDGNGQPPRYGAQSQQKLTDDRGVYRIYGLPAGTYVLSAGGAGSLLGSHFSSAYETDIQTYAPSSARNAAREIIVRAGEETANVDIRYRGEPGFTISGTARDSRSPVEPSWINIRISSISSPQENLSTYQSFGGQGFAIYGVADGDYMITAQSYSGNEWAVSESRRIRIRGADVTGIELTTRPFGSIAGRVVLEESKAPECKNKRRPVFGETVITPWHNDNDQETKDLPLFLWALGGPSTPNPDGEFTLRNLAAGQYRLQTRFFARYWYLSSITLPSMITPQGKESAARLTDAAKNWITVKRGDRLSGLVLKIVEGAASFHGQVKYPEGQKPPPRLSVFLVPAESEKAEDVLRFFATIVPTDGRFALNNMPPGRYLISARPAGESEFDLQSKLRLPEQAAERARLRQELEAGKTEIELKPCQNLTNFSLPFVFP